MTRTSVLPRVLLVEDDRQSHQLLKQILLRAGCEVISAMTQAGALNRVGGSLDCVILDLGLPDGDGEAILRRIRVEQRAVRVAVTTAEGDPERLRRVAELHPDLFLRKPIDLPRLMRWLDLPAQSAGASAARFAGCLN
jgi:two-component system KDP operon response regulator KdpE